MVSQDQSTQRIGSQDQHIDPDPRGIQGKVMDGVLQHHDRVIDGKHAGDQLLNRREKGDRAKGTAQKEQRHAQANGQRRQRCAPL